MAGALGLMLIDPTQADAQRLDTVNAQARALPRAKPIANSMTSADVSMLMQQPIFIMSTGANAYKEKVVKLFGISVTPNRRAALVSVDGQPAVWMRAGETQDELVLLEVSSNAVRFDTPVGPKIVSFSEPVTGGAG